MNIPIIPCDDRVIDIPLNELDFCLRLAKMEMGRSENMRRVAANVREMLSEGIIEFCCDDWMDRFHSSPKWFHETMWSLQRAEMIERIYGETLKYRFKTEFLLPIITTGPEIRECPYPTMDSDTFWFYLALLRKSPSRYIKQAPKIVKTMINDGQMDFTASEWLSGTGMSLHDYTLCKERMIDQQLVTNLSHFDNNGSVRFPRYRFTLRGDPITFESNNDVAVNPDFWNIVYGMCNSPTRIKQQASGIIRTLLEHGRIEFTLSELQALTKYSYKELCSALARLQECNLISHKCNERTVRRPIKLCARYRLTAPRNTLTMSKVDAITKLRTQGISIPEKFILSPDEFWGRVGRMASSNANAVRRSAEIVKNMISEGITSYTRQSWLEYSGMGEGTYAICRSSLSQRGLIYNLTADTRYDKRSTGRYAFTLDGLDHTTSIEMFMKDHSDAPKSGLCLRSKFDPDLFHPLLEEITRLSAFEGFTEKVTSFMKKYTSPFTESQWADATGIENGVRAEYECSMLLQMGLVQRIERGNHRAYSFRFETVEDLQRLIRNNEIHEPRGIGEFWNQLATLEWSKSDLIRKAAAEICKLISEDKQSFSGREWRVRTGMTYTQLGSIIRSLGAKGIVIEMGDRQHRRYWIANTPMQAYKG